MSQSNNKLFFFSLLFLTMLEKPKLKAALTPLKTMKANAGAANSKFMMSNK